MCLCFCILFGFKRCKSSMSLCNRHVRRNLKFCHPCFYIQFFISKEKHKQEVLMQHERVLGSYTIIRCTVPQFPKQNTKGIQSKHLVFGLGFLVIFRLFEYAIHMSNIYNARAIDRYEERQFAHLQCQLGKRRTKKMDVPQKID